MSVTLQVFSIHVAGTLKSLWLESVVVAWFSASCGTDRVVQFKASHGNLEDLYQILTHAACSYER